jgi:ABC-type multidrug transport system ATPase subunit
MNNLKLENVNKHYKQKHALRDFSYEFQNGIYGLLGPNGAGKSTLLNIISDNLNPDNGSKITWNGVGISDLGAEYRAILGFMPQQQSLYSTFTATRFLSYIAALKGLSKKQASEEIPQVLEAVELSDCAKKYIGGFSGGMKQRLLIAQALLGKPELILLDEPTAGLDPKQRVIIRNLISTLRQNCIVIVSTHIVSDIESIADRIIILKDGEITADGTVPELISELPESSEKSLENVYMTHFGEQFEED